MIYTIILIIAGIIADQVTKKLAVTNLSDISTYPLIENVLHFTYVENRGAAFGMLADHRWVFMLLSAAALIAMIVWLIIEKPRSLWTRTSAALIISGGIGNMIDRVMLGYVVDFIDCRFIDFYVFNVADSLVCVGCGMLLVGVIYSEIREMKNKKSDVSENSSDADETGADN